MRKVIDAYFKSLWRKKTWITFSFRNMLGNCLINHIIGYKIFKVCRPSCIKTLKRTCNIIGAWPKKMSKYPILPFFSNQTQILRVAGSKSDFNRRSKFLIYVLSNCLTIFKKKLNIPSHNPYLFLKHIYIGTSSCSFFSQKNCKIFHLPCINGQPVMCW